MLLLCKNKHQNTKNIAEYSYKTIPKTEKHNKFTQ